MDDAIPLQGVRVPQFIEARLNLGSDLTDPISLHRSKSLPANLDAGEISWSENFEVVLASACFRLFSRR